MWRPEQVEKMGPELAELGYPGDATELARLDGPVLGAIVDLAHCSGALVSESGLVVTSYHCIGSSLQHASKKGEDLFENGFYASTRADERWGGPAEHIRITVGTDDVTDSVLSGTKKLKGSAAVDRIADNTKKLVERCELQSNVRCKVAVYDQGAEYQLITQREFRDVRLVYSPPRNVGYFGGADDNWQWPRHSGDFAFLRIYADEKNNPRGFHADNKPYEASTYLPVSRQQVSEGDFVMVAGYPARTYRWRSAAELDNAQNELYPRQIEKLRRQQALFERWIEEDKDTRPKLAPRLLNIGNNLQYLEGTLHGFQRTGLSDSKWSFERDMLAWIQADRDRKERYGLVLERLNVLQAEIAGLAERDQAMRDLAQDSTMLSVAMRLYGLAVEGQKPDKRRKIGFQNRNRPQIESALDGVDGGYDWRVDREILTESLTRALRLPSGLRPAELDVWFKSRFQAPTMEGMIDAELVRLYANNDLADRDRRRSLMDSTPWYLTHHGNPWFELAEALHPYYERVQTERRARQAEIRKLKPIYLMAVQEFVQETSGDAPVVDQEDELEPNADAFYSDANTTLRLTFGHVRGYTPRDGIRAVAHTSLRGIVQKSGSAPFDVHKRFLTAINGGVFGSYGDEALNSVPVNFVSTLDTARGSSGSATLNANGQWIGVIFDGNYESMVSDWVYDEQLTRSIHTDSAYILWYLDAVAGADGLLRELGKEPELSTVTAAK